MECMTRTCSPNGFRQYAVDAAYKAENHAACERVGKFESACLALSAYLGIDHHAQSEKLMGPTQ